MAQNYYDYSETFTNGTTASATDVKTEFEAVQTGLDGVYDYTVAQLATTNGNVTTNTSALDALNAFKGTWSSLTGALSMPAAVYHNNSYWILNTDLSDVTASTPGVATEWDEVGDLFRITASGSITAGDALILNTNSTVSSVTGNDFSVGTAVEFEAGASNYISACYDTTDNRVVVAYQDGGDSSKGKAVVGTVTGATIAFGTPVEFNAGTTNYISCCYDSNADRVVILYSDAGNSNYPTAIVGDVSGTTISFNGSEQTIASVGSTYTACCFDSTDNKVHCLYNDTTNTVGNSAVGTVSGDAITFGSVTTFNTGAQIGYVDCMYDPDQDRVVAVFTDTGDSNKPYSNVGNPGATIVWGTEAAISTETNVTYCKVCYDTNLDKAVAAWYDGGNSKVYTIVGTVGASAVTWGTKVDLTASRTSYGNLIDLEFDSGSNRIAIAMEDASNSNYGACLMGTVSGTTITWEPTQTFVSTHVGEDGAFIYDPDSTNFAAIYQDDGSSNEGDGAMVTPEETDVTTSNFIGFAKIAAADSGTVTVSSTGSINNQQSGLTPGSIYYVGPDGTLTTDTTNGVKAGRAVTATEILVEPKGVAE